MKLTAKRQELLDRVKKNKQCISARELASLVPSIDQATVYRNLDLFVKEGLVKKYVFDGTESVYEYAHENHHHAVCNDCEKVLHVSVSDKDVIKKLNIKDFDVESVELTIRGTCK